MVREVDVLEFDEIIKCGKTVVCDFFANWCGPCKMLAPVMEKLSEKFEDAIFIKVDTDKNFELAARYAVMSIPLVVVFKDGEVMDKSVGFMPQSEAEEFVAKYCSQN